nr:protein FAM160A1-like [Salvelinus alpinus]
MQSFRCSPQHQGPAGQLHLQWLSGACVCTGLHKLTLEEVMTTTAYLDLFVRSVSEPVLLQTFLSFILLHRHENVHILDTLVSRINTPFQVTSTSWTRWSAASTHPR